MEGTQEWEIPSQPLMENKITLQNILSSCFRMGDFQRMSSSWVF